MKRLSLLLLVLLAVVPVTSFGLDLTVNPYSQFGLGDVTTTSFPTFTTKYTGVFLSTPFDMKDAGAIVAGLDSYLSLSASSTATKYDVYLEPNAQYNISTFSAKLGLPFDVVSSTSGASVLPSFYLTVSNKFALDKTTAITASLYKTTFYTDFTKLDIQPRVALSLGALGAYVNLKIPNVGLASAGQKMTLTPDVSYKLGDFTLEALVDFGNLNNPSSTSVSVTPWVKLQYSTKLKL